MGEVVALAPPELPRRARAHLTTLPSAQASGWDGMPQSVRQRALARQVLVLRVQSTTPEAGSERAAIVALLGRLAARTESAAVRTAAAEAPSGRKAMSRSTVSRWMARYREGGLEALADNYKGRPRAWHGWEPFALASWLTPGQMNAGSIAFNLRPDWPTATPHAVRRYLHSLPETLGRRAPERVGKHYHQQNMKPHLALDWSNLPVGFMYETDGHTLDWYTRHPLTGTPVRLEFTPVLDKASNYIVGWFVWDRESAINTLVVLSRTLLMQDHVPAEIHMDHGPGFKNKAITGELTGLFARLGIRPVFARPRNARGKGLSEGHFHHFEERVGKARASYCGHCRTDDGLRRFAARVAKGEIHVETYEETCALIEQYVQRYNAAPQKGLGDRAPAQLWATLERTPVEWPASVVFRLSEQRVVRKSGVTLAGRTWMVDTLADHDGHPVIVEYDPQDWGRVWVYDLRRRFIAEVPLVVAQDAVIGSRIEDGDRNRLNKQLGRIEQHRLEKLGQAAALAAQAIDHAAVTNEMETLEAQAAARQSTTPKTSGAGVDAPAPDAGPGDVSLDLYRTDY